MAKTSTGSGKYSLEKVMAEVLELKATQKRYAKQYLDAKSSSAADKISFISDNAKTIRTTDSANLKSRVNSSRRWRNQSIDWNHREEDCTTN